ncbi:AAA family ATPase [Mucilaginibacter sp. 5C4]|uniref:ATP-dependent nuclease n=1 Tax=Mucilaginibacter sp. 5C4 TaxID=3048589 RepID=UPI002AC931C4|nr:AAA family ATPase [Mucilaginibacter sp. 5C4]MEB0301536.1 AAA family ATPase [Mucilaginibacter sp. 5C4]WPX25339.1 AAA family ATPase [Mucilaginibacter sp. 5C4]
MAKLVQLEIKNYRSIESLVLNFDPASNLVCFIGRGDSGKTTILEAISAVLSPSWNLAFHDTDFYNCDYTRPIEILASMIDLPEKLVDAGKFGMHIRGFNSQTKTIIDDVAGDGAEQWPIPLITIRLYVDEHLEPKWTLTNERAQEDILVSASERELLNCCLIADHVDRHFSWNKGNPLYALLKALDKKDQPEEKNVVIRSLREAKNHIDKHGFSELQEATDIVAMQAAALGLNILNSGNTLDLKELSIKDGRISLHEDLIPFRLKGKGSKRLVSLAIQLALVKNGGIMLVDEIEQGLEPDRIRHLVRVLKENAGGQVFLTTHSRDAITELGAEPLCLILKDKDPMIIEGRPLNYSQEVLNKAVRACPEAFFAKKVIVCEGATEVGICRALDKYRKKKGKKPMSFMECAYVDGNGLNSADRALTIVGADMSTALLCDSDDAVLTAQKPALLKQNVLICDCEAANCIETQAFKDLPWQGLQDLLQLVIKTQKNQTESAIENAVKAQLSKEFKYEKQWLSIESDDLRTALGYVANKRAWFKRIDFGEFFGDVIFNHFDQLDEKTHLKKTLVTLSDWIDS